jgi:aspartate-semialdehyde dehydrogenase
MNNPEISAGVLGPTGLVGERIVRRLEQKAFVGDITLYASERSAGTTMAWRGKEQEVLNAAEIDWEEAGHDIVLASAGDEVSENLLPKIAEAGTPVVDNAHFWRLYDDVPLVVSEVNPDTLKNAPRRIIANPNCTTMSAMPVLKPLDEAAGLISVSMSSYQSVSGQGRKGILELLTQSAELLPGEMAEKLVEGKLTAGELNLFIDAFPQQVGFNVAPHAGRFIEDDTTEELKFKNETRKILDLGNVAIDATCARVPVLNGHSLSINAQFEKLISVGEAREILANAPGVRLVDVPQPIYASGYDDVFVGRIRKSESFISGLNFWVSCDNLLKGAATNAVQIAEIMVMRGLLKRA